MGLRPPTRLDVEDKIQLERYLRALWVENQMLSRKLATEKPRPDQLTITAQDIRNIRDQLQARGSSPLNVTNLLGLLAQSQRGFAVVAASAGDLPSATTYEIGTFGAVVSGTTIAIYMVIDGTPRTWQVYTIGSGSLPTNMFTTDTAQTGIAGNKTVASGTWDFSTAGVILKAVTQAPGDNDTDVATTAFVYAGLALKANLASPTFTGTPAAPTAAVGTNTTQIATTAFVLANSAPKTSGTAASIASGVATTIFSALPRGRYDIVAFVVDLGASYESFATVVSDGLAPRIVANNGANLPITLSGSDVQVAQTSGSAQNVTWTYIYL